MINRIEKLERLTRLYHALREEWKNLHGAEREAKAQEITYVQMRMYEITHAEK